MMASKSIGNDLAHVLIVDDSADSRAFCEMIAQTFNVRIRKARSVDEALALIDEGLKPEYILLDLVMPGLLPEELVRRVKGDPALSSTKVILMSSLKEVGAQAARLGADGSLRKPFTVTRFVRELGLDKMGFALA